MSTLTTRLGLIKPTDPEPIDVLTLDANFDALDAAVGVILVNAGVTPPNSQLFDGAVVKEKGTGIVWVAQKNGGGGYDKAYINYPSWFNAQSASQAVGSGATVNFTQVFVRGDNTSAADISGGYFVIPVTGLWSCAQRCLVTNNTGAGGTYLDWQIAGAPFGAPEANNSGLVGAVTFARNDLLYLIAGNLITARVNSTQGSTINCILNTTYALQSIEQN